MSTKKGGGKPRSKKTNRYSAEFKLQAVRLFTEEKYTAEMVATELGIGKSTLSAWVRRYRENGAAGLEYRAPSPNTPERISPAIRKKAVELKKEDPQRGSRRIAAALRRSIHPPRPSSSSSYSINSTEDEGRDNRGRGRRTRPSRTIIVKR